MARASLVRRVLVGLLLAAGPAAAQSPAPQLPPEFVTFVGSTQYANYVLQQLHAHEPPTLKAECSELKLVSRKNLSVIAQPQFQPGSPIPESGQWVDYAIVDRCGTRVQRNLLLIARGQRQFQAVALLPGETVASPQLQRDAMLPAMVTATAKTSCTDANMRVVNTAVLGQVVLNQPWREEWTFAGCGKTAGVVISFTPDGKGGTNFSATIKP